MNNSFVSPNEPQSQKKRATSDVVAARNLQISLEPSNNNQERFVNLCVFSFLSLLTLTERQH